MKFGTHARALPQTLAHGNSRNEIRYTPWELEIENEDYIREVYDNYTITIIIVI